MILNDTAGYGDRDGHNNTLNREHGYASDRQTNQS